MPESLMPESFLSGLLGKIALGPIDECISIGTMALAGENLQSLTIGLRRKAVSHLKQKLNLTPGEPNTNHDLQRALFLAYTNAGQVWCKALANQLKSMPSHELPDDKRTELRLKL